MDTAPIGNGAKMFKTMENYGLDPRHLKGYNKGGASGGVPFLAVIEFTAAASTFDLHSALPYFKHAVLVVDVHFIKDGAGGAGDTAKLQKYNGTSATDLTDAVDMNISDNVRVPCGTLDYDAAAVAKGSTLRVVTASGAVGRCIVTCLVADSPVTP